MTTHWTLGVLIGLPVAGIVVLGLLVVGILLIRSDDRGTYTSNDGRGPGIGAIVFALVVAIGTGIAFIPWKAEYHQWRPVHGKVTAVSNRIVSDGDKSVNQRFVLVVNGQPYGVDDTRASLVKVGDTVDLSCRRDWQWASRPGYVCRWEGP